MSCELLTLKYLLTIATLMLYSKNFVFCNNMVNIMVIYIAFWLSPLKKKKLSTFIIAPKQCGELGDTSLYREEGYVFSMLLIRGWLAKGKNVTYKTHTHTHPT